MKSLAFYFKDDIELHAYLTTKEDAKNHFSKNPRGFPIFVKP
jgi:hypothetical protein